MDTLSYLFILPVLLISLGTVYFVSKVLGIEAKSHRYSAIDGMRGYLAMFVFLHHAGSWWYMIHIHEWGVIPNQLYNHFGSVSVSFFFMITGFLFFTKLIEAPQFGSGIFQWFRFYVSRILRIMPLYIFAMIVLFLSIGLASHFSLREPFFALFRHMGQWMLFMEPDINRVKGTKFYISGVQWSLAYEWLFYCSLPIVGILFFRLRTSIFTIALSLLFVGVFAYVIYRFYPQRNWLRATPFATGIAAAFLVKNGIGRKFAVNKWLTPILMMLLGFTLSIYDTMFELAPFFVISLIFIAIAGGNDLFGILNAKVSRLLGQISYSLYLLHALILSTVFRFILPSANTYSILQFWCVIVVCSMVVTVVCSLTYFFIERPCLENSAKIARYLKGNAHRKRQQVTDMKEETKPEIASTTKEIVN